MEKVPVLNKKTRCLFFSQVLDAGRIHEYDAPHVLLQNQNGILYKMVQQTGKAEASSLLQTAKQVSRSPDVHRTSPRRPSMSPCPIAKYVPHVPVPETHNTPCFKELRPLCCQSVLVSPSSAACCSPFGSGSSPPRSAGELILCAGPSGADRRGFQAHIYLILDHSAFVRSLCRLN